MKRIVCLFLISIFLALPLAASTSEAMAPTALSAECYTLFDAENRRILREKNANERRPMASTTKIMTALVAIRHLPLDTVITVPHEAVGVEGSSVYLKEGDRYTLEALLHALLLQSANDAAEAIAYAVAGGIAQFADLMNREAEALGLTNTHFENPHGLDGSAHYTTANELALIACEALENPDFSRITSQKRYVFTSIDGKNPRLLHNHNKLLWLYEGATGVKTGYTKRSGRCLVSAAEREGLSLVAVTLDAPSDWSDHTALLDYGFSAYESRLIAEAGEITFSIPVFNLPFSVTVSNAEEIRLVLPKNAPTPKPILELFPSPVSPVKDGAIAGSITYRAEGAEAVSPLVFDGSITLPKNSKGWFGISQKEQ